MCQGELMLGELGGEAEHDMLRWLGGVEGME